METVYGCGYMVYSMIQVVDRCGYMLYTVTVGYRGVDVWYTV